jgi:hypothetical protein
VGTLKAVQVIMGTSEDFPEERLVDRIFCAYYSEFPIFESEMLHRREHFTRRIQSSYRGKYLPVEVPPIDAYGKGHGHATWRRFGTKLEQNPVFEELEIGAVELKEL